MIHLILLLLTCSCLTPRGPVARIPVHSLGVRELLAQPPSPSITLLKESESQASPSEFILAETTQVWLNGKPCRYAEVPSEARIVGMEIGPDRRTAVKIYFRTGE